MSRLGFGRISVSKIENGTDAYSVFLSGYSFSIPTNSSLVVSEEFTQKFNVYVCKGETKITDFAIGDIVSPSEFTVSKDNTENKTVTISIQKDTIVNNINGTIKIPIIIDDITVEQTVSYSCSVKGDDGTSASYVVATALSQVFKAEADSNTYSPNSTTITPIFINCDFNSWQYSLDGGANWNAAASGSNGITIGTVNENENCLTITSTSALFNTTNSISFRVNCSNNASDIVTIVRVKDGSTGKDAEPPKFVSIVADSQTFVEQKDGKSYKPSVIRLTPKFTNCSYSKWQYTTTPNDDDSWVDVTNSHSMSIGSANKVLTISASSDLFTDDCVSISFRIITDDNDIVDTMTVVRAQRGIGYTVILSNESHTFTAMEETAVESSTETKIIGYLNNNRVPAKVVSIGGVSLINADSSGNCTNMTTGITGLLADVSNNNTNDCTVTFKTSTSLNQASGEVELGIEIGGESFTRVFSYSLSIKGKGISHIEEHYQVSSSNTTEPSTWQSTIPTLTATNKYLWNYETIHYTIGDPVDTTKRVIGVYGDQGQTGNGISTITNHYLATSASSGVTRETSGWGTEIQSVSALEKYLWNYETINYTSGDSYDTDPCIIGAYGDEGTGYTIVLSNESHTFPGSVSAALQSSATTTVMAYKNSNPIAATITSIDGKVISGTSSVSLETTGLTASVSNNGSSSESNPVTITFNASTDLITASKAIPIVITVDGKTFTKYFSYSIAFEGDKGDPGTGYTLSMSNESHQFAGSVSAALSGSTTTTIVAYKNESKVAATITKIGGNSVSGNASGIATGFTGLTADVTNNGSTSSDTTITFTASTSLVTSSGAIPIEVSVDGKTYTKYFSFSIAFVGETGTGYTVVMSNESHQFAGSTSSALSGSVDTTLIAYKNTNRVAATITKIGDTSVSGDVSDIATGITGLTASVTNNGTTESSLYTTITFSADTSLTTSSGVVPIKVLVDGKTYTKYFSFSISFKGETGTGYTVVLSKETHAFPGDISNAQNSSVSSSVIAFKNTERIAATIRKIGDTIISGDVSDIDTGITGLSASVTNNGTTSTTIVFASNTSLTTSGSVPIILTVDGQTYTKQFSFSIAFKGDTGSPGSPGDIGPSGTNNATVFLYKRATSVPAVPSSSLIYTFSASTGSKLSGTLDDWTETIPAGTEPIYITSSTVSSTETSVTISSSSWSSPVILSRNGNTGATGTSVMKVETAFYASTSSSTPLPTPTAPTIDSSTGDINYGSWTTNPVSIDWQNKYIFTITIVVFKTSDDVYSIQCSDSLYDKQWEAIKSNNTGILQNSNMIGMIATSGSSGSSLTVTNEMINAITDKFVVTGPSGNGSANVIISDGQIQAAKIVGTRGYINLGLGDFFFGNTTKGIKWENGELNIYGAANISGSLSAATGTFKGQLVAATGSFSGSVSATTLTATKTINMYNSSLGKTLPLLQYDDSGNFYIGGLQSSSYHTDVQIWGNLICSNQVGANVLYADSTINTSGTVYSTGGFYKGSTSVSYEGHTHSGYASSSHTHSGYASSSHTHTSMSNTLKIHSYDNKDTTLRPVMCTCPDNTTFKGKQITRFWINSQTQAKFYGGDGSTANSYGSFYYFTISLQSSDIRLKENIKDCTLNALDLINQIKMYEFDFINGEEDSKHRRVGLIADELELLDKNLVSGGGYDSEDCSMITKSVDDFYLLNYVIKAEQEMYQIVQEQENKISDIETKLEQNNNECIINSSTPGSTKKFRITVDDSGVISATEVIS